MIILLFGRDNRRVLAIGHGDGWNDTQRRIAKETTEGNLAEIFEDAKENGETIDAPGGSIGAAIGDPLSYLDYLILDNGEIKFDSDYVREVEE